MSRIVADLSSNGILQVEKSPAENVYTVFNGRYTVPVAPGASVELTSASYILPQDGGDVAALSAAALLARYPMYSHIAYNFFLEAADIAEIDLAATGPSGEITRVQTGRGVGPGTLGSMPNHTAILAQNDGAAVGEPGCMVTDTIDITAATGGLGADDVMLWWHLVDFTSTEDVMSDFGATTGLNSPATTKIAEVDQEPALLTVYVSNDDGVTWTAVNPLEPTDLLVFDTDIRLAFVNTGTAKRYIAAYGVLF